MRKAITSRVYLHSFSSTHTFVVSESTLQPVAEVFSKLQNECLIISNRVFVLVKCSQRLHLSFDGIVRPPHHCVVQSSHRPNGTGFKCIASRDTRMRSQTDTCYSRYSCDLWFYFRRHYNNEIDKRSHAEIIRKMEFICGAMALSTSLFPRLFCTFIDEWDFDWWKKLRHCVYSITPRNLC